MDRFPGKVWVVSHKPVAVAAGRGQTGIHRNVIRPKSGNSAPPGTAPIGAEATACGRPPSYHPCPGCELCAAACPVGAVAPGGAFTFSACYTHDHREFVGGFADRVGQAAASEAAP